MYERLRREPDFEQFLKVLRREGTPRHLPFYEHVASPGFIARRTNTEFGKPGLPSADYWKIFADFWLGMAFDCVPMEIGLKHPPPKTPPPKPKPEQPKPRTGPAYSHGSESGVCISNREDFENYPWPLESDPVQFSYFEIVAKFLPDGAKIVGGVSGGPYEWVSGHLGTIGLAYILADDPELAELVFKKLHGLYVNAVRTLASMDFIGALRQGDDLGFKTSTFLPPGLLRKLVFPIYKDMADAAHDAGKPFILHSCGNLAEVYDDLIDCGIDAKHSFEDVIQPVGEFKKQHGDRMTPLGGLDVDVICRGTKDEIRAYTRRHIEECFADGYWALGTGNSLTDYMPVENYITALEEGLSITS